MTERDVIGIFGKMNSGKSSLMNLITQQETSIVDPSPGTTADTKITLMEIHGLGPVRLLDTAGFDEQDELGEKKRIKVISALKESDLILLVINPATKDFEQERILISEARVQDKQLIIVYNLFEDKDSNLIKDVEEALPELLYYPKIVQSVIDNSQRQTILNVIISKYVSKNFAIELLPFVEPEEFYILNIPMDEETPPGRYLRPQAMAEEYITRKWAFPVSYRINLSKARGGEISERERWDRFINSFSKRPKAIITDSQAMDIMKDWAPADIPLTTFSIMMINYMSRGRLGVFVKGVRALNTLRPGDKILIAEACNHSRIREDIGTVQIPKLIHKHHPGVIVEYSFGREFAEKDNINEYKLVIHCGGCMISAQKMAARLRDLEAFGVPITNYGIFLSYIHGESILNRAIMPWEPLTKVNGKGYAIDILRC
jgi:[FeFe] hydrogenase H-cluster maturation GTPase HydF